LRILHLLRGAAQRSSGAQVTLGRQPIPAARHGKSTVQPAGAARRSERDIFIDARRPSASNQKDTKVMTAVVSLQNIAKTYTRGKQRVEVLHALDLEIQAGEFLALMGPSGSGKTTLLNLIGGIDRSDQGELEVAGERISALASRELTRWRASHVGFVFQFYNLMPLLSAEQNVELPLLLTNLSKPQRNANVRAALELVGISDRRSHKPAELSGGQQQRVAIARALVADPTLLVCDEPTGDLDRQTAQQILDLLQMVNQEQGKTIVMVTHDPKAAERATRQLNLDKGRLIAGTGVWP
jgi:putative ABC transport system ATP-binding protein